MTVGYLEAKIGHYLLQVPMRSDIDTKLAFCKFLKPMSDDINRWER